MFLFINYEDLGKSTIPSTVYDRVQPVVYGSAKNEQYNRDQTETTCQNKYYS